MFIHFNIIIIFSELQLTYLPIDLPLSQIELVFHLICLPKNIIKLYIKL